MRTVTLWYIHFYKRVQITGNELAFVIARNNLTTRPEKLDGERFEINALPADQLLVAEYGVVHTAGRFEQTFLEGQGVELVQVIPSIESY